MADDATPFAGKPIPPGLVVSDDVKKKFPDVLGLILGSESMNNEERQYWINILPVMTPEQRTNLQQILTNERDQLKAIDKKYAKEVHSAGSEAFAKTVADERRKRRETRSSAEAQAEEAEDVVMAELMQKIEEA